MCGIAGKIGTAPLPEAIRQNVLALLNHRGPDAAGMWAGRVRDSYVTFLHTRLAIIDLEDRSRQPFEAADCALTYNGEIYNYRELRVELEALGHRFHTQSDTEVVVHAYRQWGPDCVNRFEGMWALALADLRTGVIWMSRDRFGEKPLYVAEANGQICFASEIKALAVLTGRNPTVNPTQIYRYLVNGYRSLWKNTEGLWLDAREFPAGSSTVFPSPAEYRPGRYWQPAYCPEDMSRQAALDGARARLENAVRLCMRSDVKLAFCLSGGIDSGALAGTATKLGSDIHSYSIVDSDERYDESSNIRTIVEGIGCKSTVIHTSRANFLDRLRRQIAIHDAPVTTISYYIHNFLSEAISRDGCKVAISGTGADEIFTGYYDHYGFWLSTQSQRSDFGQLVEDWRQGMGKFVNNPFLKDPYTFVAHPSERRHLYLDRSVYQDLMQAPLQEDFSEHAYSSDVLRSRMLNELLHESVPVMLREDDLNSMQYSVENRSPFLNKDLVEFMYRVPTEHLIDRGFAKSILRDAAQDALPDSVRLDRRKRGFNASILSMIDPTDAKIRDQVLDEGSAIFDYVDREKFHRFLDSDFNSNANSKFLFSFLSAQAFLDSPLASGESPAISSSAA